EREPLPYDQLSSSSRLTSDRRHTAPLSSEVDPLERIGRCRNTSEEWTRFVRTPSNQTARLVEQLEYRIVFWLAEVHVPDGELPAEPVDEITSEAGFARTVGAHDGDERGRAVKSLGRNSDTQLCQPRRADPEPCLRDHSHCSRPSLKAAEGA